MYRLSPVYTYSTTRLRVSIETRGREGGRRERERVLVELLDAARPLVIEAITTRGNKRAPPPSGTTKTLD